MVMFWDDGGMSDAYVVTNNVSRGRVGFKGSAKIDSDWSAGYRIEIGATTAGSDDVSQFAGQATSGAPGDTAGGGFGGSDLRHMFWYIESKTFGTLSVGKTDTPQSSAYTITLANINHVDPGVDDWGGNFLIRRTDGVLTGDEWGALVNPVSSTMSLVRRNEVMWTSPAFAGLQFQAAWGESDFWSVSLQYAGEFSGFRVAAKVAYSDLTDSGTWGCEVVATGSDSSHDQIDCQLWAASASVMHVPTGLFVSGGYGELNDDTRTVTLGPGTDTTDSNWWIHGGLEQKFFALGKTTLYGEYVVHQNGTFIPGYGGDTQNTWGLGIVQSIDAAAMDMYIAYRNHSVEIPTSLLLGGGAEDFQVLGVGAMIKF
jgi:hypothetical protein